MMDRHLRRDILVGIVGEKLSERIIQLDLSRLNELHDRRRREHLVHRAHPKARRQLVGLRGLAIGHSVGAAENRLALMRDQNRSREQAFFCIRVQLAPQLRHQFGFSEPRDGEFRRSWNCAKTEAQNAVWLVGLDGYDSSRELIRAAFLNQGCELRRGRAARLSEADPAGTRAEVHVALESSDFGWVVVVEELEERRAIALIE